MTRRRVGSLTVAVRRVLLLLLLLLATSSAAAPVSSSSSVFLLTRRRRHEQQQQQQRKKTIISHLPGFHGRLPFRLQTGYVEVDESHGVRLFYYFVQSERSPQEDPLVLWLTGGPGCSAFSGLVYEIGPLSFDRHGGDGDCDGVPRLVYNPLSWTKVSNVIFLDSPVGTGFSYSETEQGYRSSDTMSVSQIVIFLTKWFDEHPEFLPNPLYIAGDSYSGMIVPAITLQIAKGKEVGSEPALNLKGYVVGNPVTDDTFDTPAKYPFVHGMGLISDEIYQAYKERCGADENGHRSAQCNISTDVIDECVKDICGNHILEPMCSFASPHPQKLKLNSGAREMLQLSEISSGCRTAEYTFSATWANNDTVREALGIHKGTVPSWLRCNYDVLYTNDIHSSVKHHLDATTRGYRSLIYSGDHDMIVPFIGTQAWIRSLNFSVVDEWRPWYVDEQVAGYTRSYSNNLTFATVKGGGHTAPEYMPKQCLAMFTRWISGEPL